MLHILIFNLACVIVAYACIAFRDDPHIIDPWADLFSQRDSRMTRHMSPRHVGKTNLLERSSEKLVLDQSGVSDSSKQRIANRERRPFIKAAL